MVCRVSAKARCHGVLLPQNSDRPSPTATPPYRPAAGEATHLSFLSLGMVQDLGLELRPGRTTSRHRGEHGPPKGPESSTSSRAPLPPPARAAAAGASRARRPAGKMADGPGWLVTRRRLWQPATLGPNLRLGMEAQPPFKRTPAPSPPSGPGLPQCLFLHLPLTRLSHPPRPGHPEQIPQGTG